jgi:putative ABC transport system substrate-binding protein
MPPLPRLYFLVFLCLCWLPLPALALTNIIVLEGSPTAPGSEFVEQLKIELMQGGARPVVTVINSDYLANKRASIGEDSLVLAVGVQALSQAGKLDDKQPVLGVLVPQPSFDKILQDSKRTPHTFSAIVLDQPFSRQMALIKMLLPSTVHIGVLLGPASLPYANELRQAAKQQSLGLLQENINEATELLPKLKQVLEASSVLLAVPDPAIYNRETVQTILLTSYRYQKPVIGFSQAYVRAGALSAVFSTPRQIAKQAAEVIRQFAAKPQIGLPPPLVPKYFSVDTNRQVARSLGIELNDENVLSETLLRMERPLP